MNPKEGEINYDDAYKNFDKFYDRVVKQPITKFKINEDLTRKNENKHEKWFKTPNMVTQKETTRSLMRGGIAYVSGNKLKKQGNLDSKNEIYERFK